LQVVFEEEFAKLFHCGEWFVRPHYRALPKNMTTPAPTGVFLFL
jgi:hypothetical protein